ncbi:MAG TPA: cupin domain-containing protein, partial [Burkholderiales bacterium]|nr:cupin domain-containing protein [Burkholderiales bacterium]
MFHVGKLAEAMFAVPHGYAQHSRGYRRADLMDHRLGSVHMGAAICALEPDGTVMRRIHANEKGIYVLAGELEVKCGEEAFRVARDDYALIPYGTPHAFRNTGHEPVRWFEMQAPQPKPPGGWQDTFFAGDDEWPERVTALKNEAAQKGVGHFKPVAPLAVQAEGIIGLAAYRFMDRAFGAQHFFMMRGELAMGGRRSEHDHP